MSEKLKAVTVRWPPDLVHRVKVVAALDDLSIQELTRQAIEDRLRAREAEPAE